METATTTTPLPPTLTTSTTPPLIGVLGEPITGTLIATGVKPGGTTSEFFVTMLIIVGGLLMASPLLTNSTAVNVTGLVVAALKAGMYTWSRTQVKTAMMFGVLLFFAHTQTACAASQRTTAINATDTMTDAAGVALRAYSHDHVESIIHRPGITAAAAQLEMDAFYAKVDKAEQDITAIRGLIKNARAINDAPSVAALEAKATEVLAELKSLETP